MLKVVKYLLSLTVLIMAFVTSGYGQIAPSSYENIDFLMTFGKEASPIWGDDDNSQVHFFVIPKSETKPFYVRIFDPETSGKHDTPNGAFNTTTSFKLYGGTGAHSNKAARNVNPVKNYDAGILIQAHTFKNELNYDDKWYSIGPLNPKEGEYSEEFDGYIFKMICTGVSGNDGNAYKYALSYDKNKNIEIEDGNIFTYEMSFKLISSPLNTAHVYPFITDNILTITQFNFDADEDVNMRLTSVNRKLVPAAVSADGKWNSTTYKILEKEKQTTIDLQLTKSSAKGNDMVLYIMNQYNQAMPLFSSPIGGKPKYLYSVKVNYKF